MPEAPTLETERLPMKSLREVVSYIEGTPNSNSETLHSAEMKIAQLEVGKSWVYTDPSGKEYEITRPNDDYFTIEALGDDLG